MFKRFWSGIKSLGKKAIGFIKGMNGNKVAASAVGAIESLYPGLGKLFAPSIPNVGGLINKGLDYLDSQIEEDIEGERNPGGIRRSTFSKTTARRSGSTT